MKEALAAKFLEVNKLQDHTIYLDRMQLLRDEKDAEIQKRQRLEADSRRLISSAQSQASELREQLANAQEDAARLLQEKQAAEEKARASSEDYTRLFAASERLKRQVAQLTRDLQSAQLVASESTDRALEEVAKARAMHSALEDERRLNGGCIQELQQQVKTLLHEKHNHESELRKDFVQQMQEHNEEFERTKGEEHKQELAAVQAASKEKLDAFRETIERQGADIDQLKQRLVEADKVVDQARTRAHALENIRNDLQTRLDKAQQALDEEKDKPASLSKVIHEKNDIIKGLRESFIRKDKELDDLREKNISLTREILVLDTIIGEEETRIGVNKKRRVEDATPEPPAAATLTPSIVIGKCGAHGDFVTVVNSGAVEVVLKDWSLQSEKNKLEFMFPDVQVLQSGASVTVFTGADAGAKSSPPVTLPWLNAEGSAVFNTDGDTVWLVNPESVVVDERVIEPIKSGVGPAPATPVSGWFSFRA